MGNEALDVDTANANDAANGNGVHDAEDDAIEYFVFFAKSAYKVPASAIKFCKDRPIQVADAEAMAFVDTKKKADWEAAGITPRNIIVLGDDSVSPAQRSWYVTLQVGEEETFDPYILRQVPKDLVGKWRAEWPTEYSEEKKARYAELLEFDMESPPISPKTLKWTQIAAKTIPSAYIKRTAPRAQKRAADATPDDARSNGKQSIARGQASANAFSGAPSQMSVISADSVVLPRAVYESMAAKCGLDL